MKHCSLLATFLTAVAVGLLVTQAQARPLYLDPDQPVDTRVADLLSRMTLEEKVGQLMMSLGGGELANRTEQAQTDLDIRRIATEAPDSHLSQILQGKIGAVLQVMSLRDANAIQRAARQSRLRIPILNGTDAIHGVGWTDENTTTFPAPLILASTFDPELVRNVWYATAQEGRALGYNWFFSPNVDVARDPRWGRMGESYGEDTLLVSLMGEASVRGIQAHPHGVRRLVAATVKHLAGGGQSENGLNEAPFVQDERRLRSYFLPPFQAGIDAGAMTVMAAHNEVLGVPAHASKFLLSEVLRNEWGFKGFVVSDWGDVSGLYGKHSFVPANDGDAVRSSIRAGVDMNMLGQQYGQALIRLVRDHALDVAVIDAAVRRVLRVKFELGLFEHPFAEEKMKDANVRTKEHLALALRAAREGIILLKNENGILPLEKPMRILVTGPNADNAAILGDWVLRKLENNAITIARGLQDEAPAGTTVNLIKTGGITGITDADITNAAAAARDADIVVAAVGEDPLRSSAQPTCGENHDRQTLDLFGRQDEFTRALYASGKPVIMVIVSCRANSIAAHLKHAAAIIEAFEPGEMGGKALAEIVYGKVSPSGRLPVTIPRSVGQVPIYYSHNPSSLIVNNDHEDHQPLYWFGHGLSYTSFEYSNLKVPATLEPNKPLPIEVTVKNVGRRTGDEVVLVYGRHDRRSVVSPVKELRAFVRVSLQPGEAKTVRIDIPFDRFANWNLDMKRVVEPGEETLFVGSERGSFQIR